MSRGESPATPPWLGHQTTPLRYRGRTKTRRWAIQHTRLNVDSGISIPRHPWHHINVLVKRRCPHFSSVFIEGFRCSSCASIYCRPKLYVQKQSIKNTYNNYVVLDIVAVTRKFTVVLVTWCFWLTEITAFFCHTHMHIHTCLYILQAAGLYWMGVAAEQSGDMHAGELL